MSSLSAISEELGELDGQISDIFRALSNGFQKLEKIKDTSRQSRQLEELTDKMRECKRLIKEFDREVKNLEGRNDPNTDKMLSEKKQSMIQELNSYVALKKQYATNLESKRVDLFEGPNEGLGEENVLLASSMTNQQLVDHGNRMMDETDQTIGRGKKIVQDTIDVGTETAAALKAQTEQMSRVVNELDSIHFSIKKASKLVKEIGRQVATDRCIMALLFLIVIGVITIIIVKDRGKDKDCLHPTFPILYLGGTILDCSSKQQRHPGYSWISTTSSIPKIAFIPQLKLLLNKDACTRLFPGFMI